MWTQFQKFQSVVEWPCCLWAFLGWRGVLEGMEYVAEETVEREREGLGPNPLA